MGWALYLCQRQAFKCGHYLRALRFTCLKNGQPTIGSLRPALRQSIKLVESRIATQTSTWKPKNMGSSLIKVGRARFRSILETDLFPAMHQLLMFPARLDGSGPLRKCSEGRSSIGISSC